jgi:hypothetical protein
MFEDGEDHCRRCGADRSGAVQQELRELCPTYTGDEVDDAEFERIIKPMFQPTWGKVQWYELSGADRRKAKRGGDGGPDDEGSDGDDAGGPED